MKVQLLYINFYSVHIDIFNSNLPHCLYSLRYKAIWYLIGKLLVAIKSTQEGLVEVQLLYLLGQGWLKKWIWQWQAKFLSQIPSLISKNDTNIISLFVKNKQFCKLRRLWLKNSACHAHLKFKFQKGVAGTIFEPHLWNFGNGSLFTCFTATVTVNGLENEMSSELRFQGRKWGGRKQGNPWDPKGVERVYPCLRPPQFLTAKSTIYANFILLTVWRNVAVK